MYRFGNDEFCILMLGATEHDASPIADRIVSAAVVVQDAPGIRPRVSRWLVNPGVPVPAVVGMAIEYPAYGQQRAANELKKQGIILSPAGVRSVWPT